ncbi:MAG: LysR family transcriptional regulator, partial [Roseovarius sp.]|nr:LysR family transcriptional regulator [Roseovarius sp.]
VTQAAESLNMTQAAASAAIAALERQHDVKLFHRVRRRLELTELGRVFLQKARDVLAQAAAAEMALYDTASLNRGTLSIGAGHTVANYWLPRQIDAFQRRFPGVELKIRSGNTQEIAHDVAEGALDVGIAESSGDEDVLEEVPIAGDRCVLVVAPNHPWNRQTAVRPEEFAESDWVLREPGSGTRQQILDHFAAQGIDVPNMRIRMEYPSNEAIRAAVEIGAGAAVLSELVVRRSLQTGSLVEVPFHFPARDFYAFWHGTRFRSHALDAFLNFLGKAVRVDPPDGEEGWDKVWNQRPRPVRSPTRLKVFASGG